MSTDWKTAAWLTGVELDACWELLGLGERPTLLDLPSPGRSHTERRRVLDTVLQELRRRHLADHTGPVTPLAAALGLLARPEYEIDLRVNGPDGAMLALGVVAGEHGVVLVLRGDRCAVLPTDRTRVLPALVDLAGPLTAGTGSPVTVAAEVLDAARAGEPRTAAAFADELCRRGVTPGDAATVAHACRGVRAVGQLGTTAHGRRAPWVIGFHENATGHFVQLRRPDRLARGTTVTIAPLDAARLAAHATELIEQLTEQLTARLGNGLGPSMEAR